MTKRRTVVVVDGSNLATEGRSAPSLRQLDEAVTAFMEEQPDAEVVVVVDATFEHRVAAAERDKVKQAELNGEIVTPPAGAIGRGDAFILKIAKRAGAVVLSNDSFQEFHAEHPWLFEEGRLLGGKPVPKIGWIFTPRNPVRGQKSKAVTKRAARAAAADATPQIGDTLPVKPRAVAKKAAPAPAPAVAEPPAASAPRKRAAATKAPSAVPAPAKAAATPSKRAAQAPPATKVAAPKAQKSSGRRGARGSAAVAQAEAPPAPSATKAAPAARVDGSSKSRPEPVNTARSFERLEAEHAVGGTVEGEVVQFTSHGAMVSVRAGQRMRVVCYAPLAGLGTPAPTRARDVLKKGEVARFRIVAFDATRRRAELALAT